MTAPQHGNTVEDETDLDLSALPLIPTLAALAALLSLTLAALEQLVTGDHYTDAPRRSRRGYRSIAIPSPHLADAQRWILSHILAALPVHRAAHGYVAGRSQITAARPHLGALCLVTMDLAGWFPSIMRAQVEALFTDACRYPPQVAWALAGLVTRKGTLPQGPCTSPALSNLIAAPLDAAIAYEATQHGCKYTRYADDLILSGPFYLVSRMVPQIRRAAHMMGWSVNEAKTRTMVRDEDRMIALGLLLSGDKLTLPRAVKRRIRAAKHQAAQTGETSRSVAGRAEYLRHVEGSRPDGAPCGTECNGCEARGACDTEGELHKAARVYVDHMSKAPEFPDQGPPGYCGTCYHDPCLCAQVAASGEDRRNRVNTAKILAESGHREAASRILSGASVEAVRLSVTGDPAAVADLAALARYEAPRPRLRLADQPLIPGLGAAAQLALPTEAPAASRVAKPRKHPAQRLATSKQDYETPRAFLDAVEAEFGPLTVDLAARDDNAKAPRWITPEMDSLSVDWTAIAELRTGIGWLNPEFANIRPWAAKCQAAGAADRRILMLVPASIDANWWRDHVLPCCVVCGVSPRLTFKGATDPYPKSLALCAYGFGPPRLDFWRWRQ